MPPHTNTGQACYTVTAVQRMDRELVLYAGPQYGCVCVSVYLMQICALDESVRITCYDNVLAHGTFWKTPVGIIAHHIRYIKKSNRLSWQVLHSGCLLMAYSKAHGHHLSLSLSSELEDRHFSQIRHRSADE